MKLGVIGTGHVGVPTAATLARLGHEVVATDVDADKVARLQRGILPFYEPDLEDLVRDGVEGGRLSFSVDPSPAVSGARAVFVCVGTPPRATGEADLAAVDAAVATIARHADGPVVVVIKSTVPVGTAERIRTALGAAVPGEGPAVVSNPEFLREGNAVEDSLRPVRILVGTDDSGAADLVREIYRPLVEDGTPYIETDPPTAEVTKQACNAFLALKVSYVNAVARVCEAAGADVAAVTRAMGVDRRIGSSYLQAGLGYGGYCLPKDVRAFERAASALGYDFGLLREIERVNAEAVDAAFRKVEAEVGELEGARVALLGLSFKPGTDNVTEAPALTLAGRLLAAGAHVVGYDPQAAGNAKAEVPEMEIAGDAHDALEGAACAVLCTEWEELVGLDLERAAKAMAVPVIVDARNALDPEAARRAGIRLLRTGASLPARSGVAPPTRRG